MKISNAPQINCKNKEEKILNFIKDEDVKMAAKSQLTILHCIVEQVKVLEKIKGEVDFKLLKTLPGVGPILAMTILLETGSIERFGGPGNYSSYCRCVESKCESNGKKKGENNRKNGNAYLAWSF